MTVIRSRHDGGEGLSCKVQFDGAILMDAFGPTRHFFTRYYAAVDSLVEQTNEFAARRKEESGAAPVGAGLLANPISMLSQDGRTKPQLAVSAPSPQLTLSPERLPQPSSPAAYGAPFSGRGGAAGGSPGTAVVSARPVVNTARPPACQRCVQLPASCPTSPPLPPRAPIPASTPPPTPPPPRLQSRSTAASQRGSAAVRLRRGCCLVAERRDDENQSLHRRQPQDSPQPLGQPQPIGQTCHLLSTWGRGGAGEHG